MKVKFQMGRKLPFNLKLLRHIKLRGSDDIFFYYHVENIDKISTIIEIDVAKDDKRITYILVKNKLAPEVEITLNLSL